MPKSLKAGEDVECVDDAGSIDMEGEEASEDESVLGDEAGLEGRGCAASFCSMPFCSMLSIRILMSPDAHGHLDPVLLLGYCTVICWPSDSEDK